MGTWMHRSRYKCHHVCVEASSYLFCLPDGSLRCWLWGNFGSHRVSGCGAVSTRQITGPWVCLHICHPAESWCVRSGQTGDSGQVRIGSGCCQSLFFFFIIFHLYVWDRERQESLKSEQSSTDLQQEDGHLFRKRYMAALNKTPPTFCVFCSL